jgi:two-component system, OmpR family, sensor histidine kinase CreC
MTLTARLLLGFVLIAATGFHFLTKEVLKRVERQYLEAVEEPMVDMANVLAALLEADLQNGTLDASRFGQSFAAAKERVFEAQIYSLTKTKINLEVYVTDDQGVVLFDSARPEAVGQSLLDRRDVKLTLSGQYGARSTRSNDEDSDSSVMYVGAPIRVGARIVGTVCIAKPQRAVFQFRDETRHWLQRQISLIIISMVLASFLLARWAARPVEKLTRHALAITRGERPVTPRLPGKDMKALGQAFETMRDELEGREYVENYVQTLTHELKSPVAAIRGASELLAEDPPPEQRARFLQNITNESLRLQDLIERLLELASLEKRKSLDSIAPVDSAELTSAALRHFQPTIEQRHLKIRRDTAPGIILSADPFLLEGALSNLLQNAIEFSPDGGTIRITTELKGDQLEFQIEDEGEGIPAFAQERVFERFYSLPRPRTGHKSSGLGLCFVREVAALHRGTITLSQAGEQGTRAVLSVPTSSRDFSP